MRVEQIMSKQIQCCKPDQSLEQTAQTMWDHDCGCLPVCGEDSENKILGIITDRDITMCSLFEGKALRELCVNQAMTRDVRTCRPNESLAEAEQIMRDAKIRRLPVVDKNDCIVGMISLADLALEAVRESITSIKEITEREVNDTLASICTPAKRAAA